MVSMEAPIIIQGQLITAARLAFIRNLLVQHSDWGRTRLSEELCHCWNWRNAQFSIFKRGHSVYFNINLS